MKRTVSVTLSRLACEALDSIEALDSLTTSVKLESAVRAYLGDRDLNRPGWRYPAFMANDGDGREHLAVEFEIDAELWRSFEEEARKQGVATDELATQAAFYLAAEAEAGRLVPRLLGRVEEPDTDDASY